MGAVGDLDALRATLKQQLIAVDAAVETCINAGKLDRTDPDNVAWSSMVDRVNAYLAESESIMPFSRSAQIEAGEAIQNDLAPWYDRIQQRACAVPPKPAPPAVSHPLASFGSGLGNIEEIVKWGVIFYIASQALPLITKRRR